MKQRTLRDFSRLVISALIEFSVTVMTRMSDNVSIFATPTPTDAELEAAVEKIQTLDVQHENIVEESKKVLEQRKVAEEELKELLNARADYVDSIANGDIEILRSSGYNISKATRQHHELSMITDTTIESKDEKGTLYMQWSIKAYAKNYMVYCTDDLNDPEALRMIGMSFKSSYVASNLTSGKKLYFAVKAVNATNESPMSNFVEKIVP